MTRPSHLVTSHRGIVYTKVEIMEKEIEEKTISKNLIFWMDNPPFSILGLIQSINKFWKGRVFVLVPRKFYSSRSGIDVSSSSSLMKIDYGGENEKKDLGGVDFENSVSVVFGYVSPAFRCCMRQRQANSFPVFCISERPIALGKMRKLKNLLVLLKHRFLVSQRSKEIDFLFAMGQIGVRTFRILGWPKEKLVDFCYCPPLMASAECDVDSSKNCKFVYVGRLDRRNKGIDLLLGVFKNHPELSLTIIGDYGSDCDYVRKVTAVCPNVVLKGRMPFPEMCTFIKRFSCMLIPSRVDGWNVNVNVAFLCGLPCIVTNTCGSDEIVSHFSCGLVVPPNERMFQKAVLSFASDTELRSKCSQNAFANRFALDPDSIARYFIDCVVSRLGGRKTNLMVPPWLK